MVRLINENDIEYKLYKYLNQRITEDEKIECYLTDDAPQDVKDYFPEWLFMKTHRYEYEQQQKIVVE